MVAVRITNEHILKGKRKSCWWCPIALALSELFPDQYVAVRFVDILIGEKSYATPNDARIFISAFDASGPSMVQPFEFVLEV